MQRGDTGKGSHEALDVFAWLNRAHIKQKASPGLVTTAYFSLFGPTGDWAKGRMIQTSPQKLNLVAQTIRGLKVEKALAEFEIRHNAS